MYKECDVIIEEATNFDGVQLSRGKSIKSLFYTPDAKWERVSELLKTDATQDEDPLHVHILSNEPVGTADCLLWSPYTKKVLEHKWVDTIPKNSIEDSGYKRVIASSNLTLDIARPTKAWMTEFCKNPVESVTVEFEKVVECEGVYTKMGKLIKFKNIEKGIRPKTNNNRINIQ